MSKLHRDLADIYEVKPGICDLHGLHDPRPKLDDLVTLKPNEPLKRRVDMIRLLSKLSTVGMAFEWSQGGRGGVMAVSKALWPRARNGFHIACG